MTWLLYVDELKGFTRSKAMVALLVGLPALSVAVQLLQPDTEGVPLAYFVAILASSIGGTLGAVLLSTSITSERLRHVYDLFLVRPVQRHQLVLAKFFSAFTCLVVAVALSIGLGFLVDAVRIDDPFAGITANLVGPLVISVAGVAAACGIGVLFGMLFSSIALAAIVAVYLGNQLTAIIILPTVFIEDFQPVLYGLLVGSLLPAILLTVAIVVFRRKAL